MELVLRYLAQLKRSSWETMAKCVNCEKPTSGSLEFCQRCYNQFKEDIKDKKPWVKVLKNDAQRERRRREREFNDVSLDAIQDAWNDRQSR